MPARRLSSLTATLPSPSDTRPVVTWSSTISTSSGSISTSLLDSATDAIPELERSRDRLTTRVPIEMLEPQQVIAESRHLALRSGRGRRARPRGSRAGSARQGRACEAGMRVPRWSCHPSARGRRTAPRAGRGRAERGRPRAAASRREHRPDDPSSSSCWRRCEHARPSAPIADRRGSTRENASGINRGTLWSTTFSRASSFEHADDSCMQQRALADAARAVQHRDPIRAQVVARRLPTTRRGRRTTPRRIPSTGRGPGKGEGRARTAASAGTARLIASCPRIASTHWLERRRRGSRSADAPRT